jgi:hypothetical protein
MHSRFAWLVAFTAVLAASAACGDQEGAAGAATEPLDGGGDGPDDLGTRGTVDAASADTFVLDLAPEPPAPPPWVSRDVGAVGAPGRTSSAAGIFFVRASGGEIGGTADAFQFLFQPTAGDAELVAHLSELEAEDPEAKAGLMIRGSLEAGAPYAALLVSKDGRALLQTRASAGAPAETRESAGAAALWVRISRAGSNIRAAVSSDRQEWTEVGQVDLDLPAQALLGLAVAGNGSTRLTTAVFHSVRITSLAPPWIDGDVGDVAIPGSARVAGERAVLTASGSDIGGPSDQFTYLYQPFAGDGEITARVAGFNFSDPNAKVGLMFRAGLAASAAHLSLMLTPLGNVVLRRGSQGAATQSVGGTLGQLPLVWLRMARIGPLLFSSLSADGLTWVVIQRENLAMPPPPMLPLPPLTSVGLALTSRNNSRVASARLDNVVVKSYPPYPVDGGTDGAPDAGAPPDAAGADGP